MRNLSKSARILIAILLFGILYVPTSLLWNMARPAWCRVLASVSQPIINIIEITDTSYRIEIEGGDFKLTARMAVKGKQSRPETYELSGTRKGDLVTYNLNLWAALFLATVAFIGKPARWKYLLLAPLIIVLFQFFDLAIFAKNTRWILVKDLSPKFPYAVDYNYSWHWFWYWAQELDRRILDPFLPLLLWIMFCVKSFLLSHLGAEK